MLLFKHSHPNLQQQKTTTKSSEFKKLLYNNNHLNAWQLQITNNKKRKINIEKAQGAMYENVTKKYKFEWIATIKLLELNGKSHWQNVYFISNEKHVGRRPLIRSNCSRVKKIQIKVYWTALLLYDINT